MPPIETMNSTTTPQMPFSASRRSAQDERSPAGPADGSRHTTQRTARHSSAAARMPGNTPAANSRPMLVSVMMP